MFGAARLGPLIALISFGTRSLNGLLALGSTFSFFFPSFNSLLPHLTKLSSIIFQSAYLLLGLSWGVLVGELMHGAMRYSFRYTKSPGGIFAAFQVGVRYSVGRSKIAPSNSTGLKVL